MRTQCAGGWLRGGLDSQCPPTLEEFWPWFKVAYVGDSIQPSTGNGTGEKRVWGIENKDSRGKRALLPGTPDMLVWPFNFPQTLTGTQRVKTYTQKWVGKRRRRGLQGNINKSLGLKLSCVAVSCRNSQAEPPTCVDTAGFIVRPAHVCIFLEEYPPHSYCKDVGT